VKLRIAVDERVYEVDVEVLEEQRPEPVVPTPYAPYPATAAVPAQHAAPSSGDEGGDGGEATSGSGVPCKSPVNGVVVKVVVEVGQHIEAGAPLIILEAMKMQTSVTAPVAGTVASIRVEPGAAVKRDQVVVELAE